MGDLDADHAHFRYFPVTTFKQRGMSTYENKKAIFLRAAKEMAQNRQFLIEQSNEMFFFPKCSTCAPNHFRLSLEPLPSFVSKKFDALELQNPSLTKKTEFW